MKNGSKRRPAWLVASLLVFVLGAWPAQAASTWTPTESAAPAATNTKPAETIVPSREACESVFGAQDFSSVGAYTGGQAKDANKAMNAQAYARGSERYCSPTGDMCLAAHEAAHCMQQQGAGKPKQ